MAKLDGAVASFLSAMTIASVSFAEEATGAEGEPSVAGEPSPEQEPSVAEESSVDEAEANKDSTAGEGASTPLPEDDSTPLPEDDHGWVQWPFDSKSEISKDYPKTRWAAVGAFVGWVHRPSGTERIRYRPGVAYGGYLRAEVASWFAVRIFYREERIPVEVSPGGFDYAGVSHDRAFQQENLEVVNLGALAEPMWVVHPRFRLRGIVGWSWMGFRAPIPNAPDTDFGGHRSGVATNFTLGAGLSFDIIKNWWDVGVNASYSIVGNQTGSAFEPTQIVLDGAITHLAPLPEFQNSTDILFTMGLIL